MTALLVAGALFAASAWAEDVPESSLLGVDPSSVVGAPERMPVTEEPLLNELVDHISLVIRCPQCQNQSISESPSDAAINMKMQVRELLAKGYSEEQVLAYLERSYGESVRLEPKAEGVKLLVWAAPAVLLLIAVAIFALRLRGPRQTAEPERIPDDLQPYLERVRREAYR